MKILLIEDEKFLRTALEKKLKDAGFEVITAIDGNEALNKIVSERPDMILLDIILPKKSGFSILEEINKDPEFKNITVLIISNLGQEEDMRKGLSLGAIEYFVKAKISLDELVNKIKEYAQKKSKEGWQNG